LVESINLSPLSEVRNLIQGGGKSVKAGLSTGGGATDTELTSPSANWLEKKKANKERTGAKGDKNFLESAFDR